MIYIIDVKDGGHMETTNPLIAIEHLVYLMDNPREMTITVRDEPREEPR